MLDEEKPAVNLEDGVEVDDPDEPDTGDSPDELDDEDDVDLLSLLQGEGDEDEEGEGDEDEEEQPEPTKPQAQSGKTTTKPAAQTKPEPEDTDPLDTPQFSQRQVNEMVTRRLAKNKQATVVNELEALTGKPLTEYLQQVKKEKREDYAERFAMSDEEADKYLNNEVQAAMREIEARAEAEQSKTREVTNAYYDAKRKALKDPAVSAAVKRFESEIDAFADHGHKLPFEVAMFQILGQKYATGEVQKAMKAGIEQKVLRDVQKGRRHAVESASQPGGGREGSNALDSQERAMARLLGVTAKEYADEKARLAKRRRR